MPSSKSSQKLVPDHYLPDLPPTQRCRCELPSASASSAADRSSSSHDDSVFFRALFQPYTPTRLDKSQPSSSSMSDLAREFENGMIDYHEDHKKLARMARHSQDEARRIVVKHPRPDIIANLTLYQPKGQWAWIGEVPLDESEDEIFISRHEGHEAYKLRIKVARASDVRITYLSKLLSEGPKKWTGFWAEAALFKTLLQPFHNHLVPAMIGIYNTYRGIQFVFDIPHHSFWIQASADMPDILKQRCFETYRQLHEQGVLHGNVDLANILIGGDGQVKLINFHQARATLAMPYVHLEQATPEEFAVEMREVLYKLDYNNARFKEQQNWRDRHREKRAKSKGRGKGKAKEAPPDLDPFNVPLEPPIDPGPKGFNWEVPNDWKPKRFVVPGQTQKQFKAHVKLFLSSLQRAELEQAETSKQSRSTKPIPFPSHPPSRSSSPARSITTEAPARRHYNLRKRPGESLPDDKLPNTKRIKLVDFFPLVTAKDGSYYSLKPPPTAPYNPRTFWRGRRRKVKEEPEEADPNILNPTMSIPDSSSSSNNPPDNVPANDTLNAPSLDAASSRASPPTAPPSTVSVSTLRSQSQRQTEAITKRNTRELQMKLCYFLNRLPSQNRWRKSRSLVNQGGSNGGTATSTTQTAPAVPQRSDGNGTGNIHNRTNGTESHNPRKRRHNDSPEETPEGKETRPFKKLRRSETLILVSGPNLPCTRKAIQVLAEGESERSMGDHVFIHRPSPLSSPEPDSVVTSPQVVQPPFDPQVFDCTDEDLNLLLEDAVHPEMGAVEYDFDMDDAEDFLFKFMSETAARESEVVRGERNDQREPEASGRVQEDGSHEHASDGSRREGNGPNPRDVRDPRHKKHRDVDVYMQDDNRHLPANNPTQRGDFGNKDTVCKEEETDIQLEWDNASEESQADEHSEYNEEELDDHPYQADELLEYGISPADADGLPMTSMQKFIAIVNAMQETRAEERQVEGELLAAESGGESSVFTTLGSMIRDRVSAVSHSFRSLLPSN